MSEIIKCAHNKIEKISNLVSNPRNPNIHPLGQIKLLAKIIDFQGQRAPIVVSKRSGFITKGHGRLEAFKLLGWEECAIDLQEYENEAEEYADLVADNQIQEFSRIDNEILKESLIEFEMEDFNFDYLAIPTLDLDSIGIKTEKQLEEEESSKDEGNIDDFIKGIYAEVNRRVALLSDTFTGFEETISKYLIIRHLKEQTEEQIIIQSEEYKGKELS